MENIPVELNARINIALQLLKSAESFADYYRNKRYNLNKKTDYIEENLTIELIEILYKLHGLDFDETYNDIYEKLDNYYDKNLNKKE